jgi:hypothetical protein
MVIAKSVRFCTRVAILAFLAASSQSTLRPPSGFAAPPQASKRVAKSDRLAKTGGVAKTSGATKPVSASKRDRAETLTPIELQAVEIAARAYTQGSPLGIVQALSPLVPKFDGPRMAVLDRELADRKLPSAGHLLAESRMTMAVQGAGHAGPRPSARESLVVLQSLKEQYDAILAEIQNDPIMADPLVGPSKLQAYEDLLWGGHVLTNRLLAARRIAQYAATLVAPFPRKAVADLPQSDKALLTANYAMAVQRVDEIERDLHERTIELRMQRLAVSRQILEKPALTPERFKAAYAWSVDARMLEEYYRDVQQAKRPPSRPKLTDTAFQAEATDNAKRAQELAGDLTQKATWLFEGMHWWYRGRYGAGPELWGLAKSQDALRSPEAMFPIYMPTKPPTPVDPFAQIVAGGTSEQADYPERRHHYWWAWEDRGMQTASNSSRTQNSDYDVKRTDEVAQNHTWQFW